MNKKNLNGFNISTGAYSDFVSEILSYAKERRSAYACVANVHMFIEAYKNETFNSIINEADIITPDGVPLCWWLRLKYGIKQQRVAGMDLLPDLLIEMEKKELKVYFYGGSDALINQTGIHLKQHYPLLQVVGLKSPPFRELTEEEEERSINEINSSEAQLVFVILGCPRQEKWMASMKGRINAMMVGVGGALPVLIGMQKRAPKWMQRSGLEWFYRLAQEPARLFKRYAITNTLFLYLLSKDFIRSLFLKKAY